MPGRLNYTHIKIIFISSFIIDRQYYKSLSRRCDVFAAGFLQKRKPTANSVKNFKDFGPVIARVQKRKAEEKHENIEIGK